MGAFLASPDVVRQPGIAMAVNGQRMPGLVSLAVTRNNFFAADTFTAHVALDQTGTGYAAPYWADQDTIELNLMLSLDGGALQSVILGPVDIVSIDPARQVLTLSGRDYSSAFIDSKTAEKFQNLTSSQIVQTLAARHGLQAQVQATTTPAGKYYDVDHAEVTNQVSEWTLLTYLAQHEGFDIFVEAKTVYFQPPATTAAPYVITYDASGTIPAASVKNLVMQRNLALTNAVIVKVISWNHELKTAITATRQAKPTAGSSSGTSPTYIFREAGLTQSQADSLAVAKLTDITSHERRVVIDMPGDPSLTPRSMLQLTGTGTQFDQTYYISELRLDCALKTGLRMRVEARNSSPQSVVTV
jgi:phage protein D